MRFIRVTRSASDAYSLSPSNSIDISIRVRWDTCNLVCCYRYIFNVESVLYFASSFYSKCYIHLQLFFNLKIRVAVSNRPTFQCLPSSIPICPQTLGNHLSEPSTPINHRSLAHKALRQVPVLSFGTNQLLPQYVPS